MYFEIRDQIQDGLLELTRQFSRFSDSFGDLTDPNGDAVSDNLITTLGLTVKSQSDQTFWESRTLKQNAFHDLVHELGDDMPYHSSPSDDSFAIDYVYFGSKRTLQTVTDCVSDGMFHSDNFCNFGKGEKDFCLLVEHYVDGHVNMESRFGFCTPSKPHATIISVQPQQGPPDKLVITELFTLMYWAHRCVKRSKKFMSLPIRVVSICDTKARFISANFSHGYLRCMAKINNPDYLPVTADLDIGQYYEMSQKDDLIRFMRQLVDLPVAPDGYARYAYK